MQLPLTLQKKVYRKYATPQQQVDTYYLAIDTMEDDGSILYLVSWEHYCETLDRIFWYDEKTFTGRTKEQAMARARRWLDHTLVNG